jgi:hypothetical protein
VAGVPVELELGLLAGLVHGGQRVRVRPAASPSTAKRLMPAPVLGGDDDEVRGVAVEHEHLGAVEVSSRRRPVAWR